MLSSDIRDTDPAAHERLGVGLHTFEIKIPPRLLAPTTYLLTINCVHPIYRLHRAARVL